MNRTMFYAQNVMNKLISQNGFLYNGYAAGYQFFAPHGWRVSHYYDWFRIAAALVTEIAGKLKETSCRNWNEPNTGATDAYRFTLIPNGYRYYTDGSFGYIGQNSMNWATGRESGTAYPHSFARADYNSSDLTISDGGAHNNTGLGIRVVREFLEAGCLYNFYAVYSSRNLAPSGCHIPTNAEWTTLRNLLGGQSYGGYLKEEGTLSAGTGRWASPNTGASNPYSFGVIPEGRRHYGTFDNWTLGADFWSKSSYNTDQAYSVNFGYNHSNMYMSDVIGYAYKEDGFSVRCIVDDDTFFGPFYDSVNGEIYDTVKIGSKVWLASNLRSTKYRDGTAIPNVTDSATWRGLTSGAYCWYNNSKPTYTQPSLITDYDGNSYGVIQIGKELWCCKNWICTRYNDGGAIAKITDNSSWIGYTSGAYCSYNNFPFN